MNAAQRSAVRMMQETKLLEYLRDNVEKTLFEMFMNAPSDEIRLSIGRKVDVVDDVFQQFEEILLEKENE